LINKLCPSKENQKENIENHYLYTRFKDKDIVRNVRVGNILSSRNDTDKIFKLNQSLKLKESILSNQKQNKKIEDLIEKDKTQIRNTLDDIYVDFYRDL